MTSQVQLVKHKKEYQGWTARLIKYCTETSVQGENVHEHSVKGSRI